MELAACTGGVWAGGAVKNGLSEEHTGEKMPQSTPITMTVVWWC